MKTNLTAAERWWNNCAEYEATHEIAFAAPRALLEARMIEAMDKARRPRLRVHKNARRPGRFGGGFADADGNVHASRIHLKPAFGRGEFLKVDLQ